MTGRIKRANRQRELEALAFSVLASFRHHGAMQWTEWHEMTRARRGKLGLGTTTFSNIVKRLTAEGRVRVDGEGCYQGVFDVVEDDLGTLGAGNSAVVDTELLSGDLSRAFRGVGNGSADITDIALQQLMNTEG